MGRVSKTRKWQPHGTIGRYRQGGCAELSGGVAGTGDRCSECRLAMSEFNRNGRAAGSWSIDDAASNVTSIRGRKSSKASSAGRPAPVVPPPIHTPGPTEEAVIKQATQYADEQPVLVEIAKGAARILDNPDRAALHPTTQRNLQSIMETLTASKKKKSRGRLAAVQSMTGSRSVRDA